MPDNVNYIFQELTPSGEYSKQIVHFANDVDLVVIDGRDRVNCAKRCAEHLNPRCAIIWDNSDRTKYTEGFDILVKAGYKRLDFFGHGPIKTKPWCTSIFYKPENCLEI